METAQSTTENLYYSNINTTRIAKPSGYPTDTYTNPNDYVAKVRGDGNKIGPAIILKVMAGDKFNLRVSSWWNSGSTPGTPVSLLNDLISALSNGVASVAGGKATATELTSTGISNAAATGFLNSQSYNSSKPKAFVNWIFLDEQFKYYGGGFEQVDASNTFKTHLFNDVAINKSGYLYVYVSNETPNIDVFFDNLQVTHVRGPLLSEDHFYPFGGRLFGICSQSLNFGKENKYKFNGAELNKDFDLNQYEFFYRNYDPQIGRWQSLDPKPDEMFSLYSSMGNNPILYSDILGDTARGVNETSAQGALDAAQGAFNGIEGGDAVSSLFSLDKDGVTFSNIDKDAFNKAYEGLTSDDAKALAMEYYGMINSDKTQFVAILKEGETLDLSQAKNLDPKTISGASLLGMKQGTFDPTLGGGGITSYTKSTGQGVTQIAMNPKVQLDISVFNGYYKHPTQIHMTPSISFILSHEFGHALMAQRQTTGSFLPNFNANKLTALQVNGIYLRAHGFKSFYDVSSHWRNTSFTSAAPFTRSEVIQIPSFLKR